jgi:hypothetical protein
MQTPVTQLRLDGGEDSVGLTSPKRSDHCMSPPWVCQLAVEALDGIDLDRCSHPQSIVPARRKVMPPEDGLLVPGEGLRVYTNCPFSNPLPWAEIYGQAAAELFLIRIDATTKWWRLLWDRSRTVILLRKRIAFGLITDDGAVSWDQSAMWSCAVFGAGAVRCRVLAEHGYVAKRDRMTKRSLKPAHRRPLQEACP